MADSMALRLAPGERLDDYEIVAPIKAGGMARLFLGRRTNNPSGSFFAIKVLHEHLSEDQEFVRMFRGEARVAACVNHPNVVRVFDVGYVRGVHYMVMEYVHGCTVSRLARLYRKQNQRLPMPIAVWLACEIAAGVHGAHEATGPDGQVLGVIHRDISPQNVLLSFDGKVKLTDFGVARASGSYTTASLKGKLAYMAPEQARGEDDIDRRLDVYALGLLTWELLSGRRRFRQKNDVELMQAVIAPEQVSPSRYNEAISPELDWVVNMAMSVDPADRYSTAEEFQDALIAAEPAAADCTPAHLATLLTSLVEEELELEASAGSDPSEARTAPRKRSATVPKQTKKKQRPISPPHTIGTELAFAPRLQRVTLGAFVATSAAVVHRVGRQRSGGGSRTVG